MPGSIATGSSGSAPSVVQFGLFEADLVAHELRKSGVRVRLQEQPFHVLTLLLQRPGEVVAREQLREAVWPAGTFIEFDRGLNTAVKKIRSALGDSADNPRFIETLPRKGYRFIAPVFSVDPSTRPAGKSETRWLWYAIAVCLSLLLVGAGAWLGSNHASPEAYPTAVPLTTYPGVESQPSFSPDGNQVAFIWDGEQRDSFHIYVKQIGVEKPVRLTYGRAADSQPAWSPDGRYIAWVRDLQNGKLTLFLMPSIGGPERKLREIRAQWAVRRHWTLAWSTDGKWLAFPERDSDIPADETTAIAALAVETSEQRRLTYPKPGEVDAPGAFSPDGRTLAFRRGTNSTAELFILPLSQDLKPQGVPRQITRQQQFATGFAWTPDGRDIVYYTERASRGEMWRVPAFSSRTPRRVAFAGDQVGSLAISARGHRLAYERLRLDTNIWRMDLRNAGGKSGKPIQLISSTWNDGVPQYSPDGNRIAFVSDRSGYNEIWISRDDGSEPFPLTSLRRRNKLGPPRWSRDGKQIYCDSSTDGNFQVFVVDLDGGKPRFLTNERFDSALPAPSHDGRWLYFASSRSGRFEIWKMPVEGGEPLQVTRNWGWVGFESPDGNYLYYANSVDVTDLWRLRLTDGLEEKVATGVVGRSLCMGGEGIYFARPPQTGGNRIERLSLASGKTTLIATTPQPISWFLGVSPDERYLLFTGTDQRGSDLMLAENFR